MVSKNTAFVVFSTCCHNISKRYFKLERSRAFYHHKRCLAVSLPYYQYHHHLYYSSLGSTHSQKTLQSIKDCDQKSTVNRFVNRSHTCGELDICNVGEKVYLQGWLQFVRMGKFFVIQDSYGTTQCIIPEQAEDLSKILKGISFESVIAVTGMVLSRSESHINPKMKTGHIEVEVESIEILNSAMKKLPFYVREQCKANETLQLQYRYLALRFPELQRNLRTKSWLTMKMRDYLVNKCGFVDVVTPTLFRKTPGGAQEFIVPTQHPGKCYSLVQSPQQFKQLLMVGGMDRYFQMAQCYRDEGPRRDRQPEFTQLDIEMSFVNRKDIMLLIEELLLYSWPEFLELSDLPFHHLTYEEAMEMYGTDCPDLRIPGRIYNVSPVKRHDNDNFHESFNIYATAFNGKHSYLTRSTKEKLKDLSKQICQKASLIQLIVSDASLTELSNLLSESTRINIVKSLNLQKDDVLLLTYGPQSNARKMLGRLRLEFVNILESKGENIRSPGYKFAWIYDFPLFSMSDLDTLESTHHPFTLPHPEDIEKLFSNPLEVRGLQYDLVLNGSEIGGGSIRIHEKKLQKAIFKLLNIEASKMQYFLEALDSGAPPHGGFALGLDRYISILCNASSLKEVIAFPKTLEGRDLMSGAPANISEEDKQLYNIYISDTNKK